MARAIAGWLGLGSALGSPGRVLPCRDRSGPEVPASREVLNPNAASASSVLGHRRAFVGWRLVAQFPVLVVRLAAAAPASARYGG
jgi:hypothetical protein